MARFKIICVKMENPALPRAHTNILRVGIADKQFRVEDVANWIETGEHTFFTTNAQGLYERNVQMCPCGQSTRKHLRSMPDQRVDNNLEAQPECQ